MAPNQKHESPSPRKKTLRRRVTWAVVLILAGSVGWLATRERVSWDISVTCVRCLQRATLYKKDFAGVTWYRKAELRRGPVGIMHPASFGPDMPSVDPKLYQKILGHPCDHRFLGSGGVGRTNSSGVHADGTSLEASFEAARLTTVEAIFRAYHKTDARAATARLYHAYEDADDFYAGVRHHLAGRFLMSEDPERTLREVLDGQNLTTSHPLRLGKLNLLLKLHQLNERLIAAETAEAIDALREEYEALWTQTPPEW